MNDGMFKWAATYAAMDLPVVICHGYDGNRCTCRSSECATPGKHPVMNAWQHRATTDESELAEWLDGRKPYNIGIAWGERSGIIDIEYDTEEGRMTAERFGLDKLYTPTFTSKRSTHRLVKWDARLPQQAVYKFMGLEIRIGGGSRGAFSVVPPSIHASGISYSWVEGMCIADCEVAAMPRELLVAISNAASTESGEKKEPATKILHNTMGEGDRHHALVRIAARMCINMINCHDPVEQQDVLATLRSLNKTQCNPPKQDDEIENIWRHELAWAAKKRAERGLEESEDKAKALAERLECGTKPSSEDDDGSGNPFGLIGLERRGCEFWPGKWRLKVVHADPVAYVLKVPVFRQVDGKDQTVTIDVNLDAEKFRSAAKVAQAILEATHTVVVDDIPSQWAEIWNGRGGKKDQPAIRGMKAKLMDVAIKESATAENCRFATVATWLLEVLGMTPKPAEDEEEDGTPDVTGMPAWVRKDGIWELWFAWTKAWEMVDRGRRKLEPGDVLKTKKMLLAAVGHRDLLIGRAAGENGTTRRFVRFTNEYMKALEKLASGEFGAEGKTAFSIHAEIENEIEKSSGNVDSR